MSISKTDVFDETWKSYIPLEPPLLSSYTAFPSSSILLCAPLKSLPPPYLRLPLMWWLLVQISFRQF